MQHIDNNGRRSRAVIANGTVFMGGQVADMTAQTQQTLARIATTLAKVGIDKSRFVSVQIWLKTMGDYVAMNAVWNAWVELAGAPARSCGVVAMAHDDLLVAIIPTAALSWWRGGVRSRRGLASLAR